MIEPHCGILVETLKSMLVTRTACQLQDDRSSHTIMRLDTMRVLKKVKQFVQRLLERLYVLAARWAGVVLPWAKDIG